ncbi:hypothetical protein [Brevibacterium yomogidense]|uniref:hypothetical protein n=1 Tax=Brevibacterium yomogidense TaxID=946573 RepID=UPI0018DFD7B0|nr:hypothetical protein [Brevibacterium yomogidense]
MADLTTADVTLIFLALEEYATGLGTAFGPEESEQARLLAQRLTASRAVHVDE